tara:strand:- start:967 stop:1209 length:243 start_codon:yes stop_codon:yes gene_type:complete
MTVYFDKRKVGEDDKKLADAKEKEINLRYGKQVVGFFINPVILMLVWNWLMPGLFGLQAIGYLKAMGLYVISRILFVSDE